MTVTSLIDVLMTIKKTQGNKPVKYIGVANGSFLFEENITTIKVCDNDNKEPVILCGDSYHELVGEPLIKLNRIGRFFKSLITEPVKNK